MKIKRFFAEDIRQAMRMVKEELGADAVIMSNRSVDGGVEIVAARDFDEQLIQSKFEKQLADEKARSPEIKKPALQNFAAENKPKHIISSTRKKGADGTIPQRPVRRDSNDYQGYAEKAQLVRPRKPLPDPIRKAEEIRAAIKPVPEQRQQKDRLVENVAVPKQPEIPAVPEQEAVSEKLVMDMFKELKALRLTMNNRFSELGWSQSMQNNPVRLDLLRRLADMGIAKKLSVKIANRLANHQDVDSAFKKAQEMLINVLPIVNDSMLDFGGIVALVGPTGVGKTTTIAKLAAQFILKHGSDQVALITTDNYRIAAHDQLNTYGRILNVPVKVAADAKELRELIDSFSDKKLILIDTAGMSQRDKRLAEQIKTLEQDELPIKSYLVMSATTQYKATKEILKAFEIFQPEAGILTKLDETAIKGAALSALIEHRLPLAFITDGQQVPEDLHNAEARSLVSQCVAELEHESDNTMGINYDDWVAQSYA